MLRQLDTSVTRGLQTESVKKPFKMDRTGWRKAAAPWPKLRQENEPNIEISWSFSNFKGGMYARLREQSYNLKAVSSYFILSFSRSSSRILPSQTCPGKFCD